MLEPFPYSFKNSSSLGALKNCTRENKNLLNSISFEKASCSVPFKSIDFKSVFRPMIVNANSMA